MADRPRLFEALDGEQRQRVDPTDGTAHLATQQQRGSKIQTSGASFGHARHVVYTDRTRLGRCRLVIVAVRGGISRTKVLDRLPHATADEVGGIAGHGSAKPM